MKIHSCDLHLSATQEILTNQTAWGGDSTNQRRDHGRGRKQSEGNNQRDFKISDGQSWSGMNGCAMVH